MIKFVLPKPIIFFPCHTYFPVNTCQQQHHHQPSGVALANHQCLIIHSRTTTSTAQPEVAYPILRQVFSFCLRSLRSQHEMLTTTTQPRRTRQRLVVALWGTRASLARTKTLHPFQHLLPPRLPIRRFHFLVSSNRSASRQDS